MKQTRTYANDIKLTDFFNLRDGGNLPLEVGRLLPTRLLRSDAPEVLDPSALEFFKDLPLSLVVDLRTEEEIEAAPSLYLPAGFEVSNIGIFGGSITSMLEDFPSIDALYLAIIDNSGTELAAAVSEVASKISSGSVLVHCTAGKDRTGIVIALIQSLLGVPRDVIIENYTATQKNLDGQWFQNLLSRYASKFGMNPEQFVEASGAAGINFDELKTLATSSPASAIEGALSLIDSQYGGVGTYLSFNGLSEDSIQALKDALVVTD